jgi:probable phosphoglycerate mutase
MTRFLLIRHGNTDAVGKRLAGRTKGVHLNEEGKEQVQKLSARLKGLPISALYSSSLERALETAEPISRLLNQRIIVNDDFLELDFGDWTNKMIDEVKNDPQFNRFNIFRSSARIPGGELMPEAQLRIINGMQKLCGQHEGETIAIVSHGDIIKAAITYYAGIHLDLFQRIEISPASVSIVEVFDDTARILVVNDTGQLSF